MLCNPVTEPLHGVLHQYALKTTNGTHNVPHARRFPLLTPPAPPSTHNFQYMGRDNGPPTMCWPFSLPMFSVIGARCKRLLSNTCIGARDANLVQPKPHTFSPNPRWCSHHPSPSLADTSPAGCRAKRSNQAQRCFYMLSRQPNVNCLHMAPTLLVNSIELPICSPDFAGAFRLASVSP